MTTLVTKIEFNIKNNKFKMNSEAKTEFVKEIVENVIRAHVGAGIDKSKRNERDVYSITITWDFSDDSFVINSDTGNLGLTDGILMHFLETVR